MTAAGTTKKARKAKAKSQPPIPYLCALVNGWHATTKRGEDKDFPCHVGDHIAPVMAALKQFMDDHDIGLLRDASIPGGGWRLCDDDTNLWKIATNDAEIVMFAMVWKETTGRHIGAARAREAVATLAAQSGMHCASWNLPMRDHAHVTLAGDGTLILIDAKGNLTTRAATRADMLTPEACPAIDAQWAPGATCPVTDRTVSEILMRGDPIEHAALIETYWAAASQILLRGERSRTTRRAVVIWGEAFSGKSILLKIMRAVTDGHLDNGRRSLVCTTKLEEFDTPFGLAKMPGCLLWLVDETTEGYQLKDVATFKQLVDDAPVTVNVKYQEQMPMRLHLPIFVATNSPPSWVDMSKGTSSRVLMINTKLTFVPAAAFDPSTANTQALRPDEELYADLANEQAGILQKLALAAQAMLRAGTMPVSQETQAASDTKFTEDDRIAEFVAGGLTTTKPPGWVGNHIIVRAIRGMVYATGGGRIEAERYTTLTMRKRLFNRIRLTFKCETGSGWHDGKSIDVQPGVWLTPEGLNWLAWTMRNDDNMRGTLSDYRLEAARGNGPTKIAGLPRGGEKGGENDPKNATGNVIPLAGRGAHDD